MPPTQPGRDDTPCVGSSGERFERRGWTSASGSCCFLLPSGDVAAANEAAAGQAAVQPALTPHPGRLCRTAGQAAWAGLCWSPVSRRHAANCLP